MPAGAHVIALVWRPWTVFIGALFSAISGILLILAYNRLTKNGEGEILLPIQVKVE